MVPATFACTLSSKPAHLLCTCMSLDAPPLLLEWCQPLLYLLIPHFKNPSLELDQYKSLVLGQECHKYSINCIWTTHREGRA